MSAPEANDFCPAPRTTRTFTSWSWSTSPRRSGSASYMPSRTALWLSGRLSTKVAIAPERSTTRSSVGLLGTRLPPLQFWVLVEDDVVVEQAGDLVLVHATLAEDLPGVLAEPRRWSADLEVQPAEPGSRADGAHRADDRVIDVDHHVARDDVWVVEGFVVGENRSAGDAGLVADLHPLVRRAGGGDRLDLLLELVDVCHPVRQRREAGIGEPLRVLDDVLGEPLPELVVVGTDRHVAVGGAVGLVRRRAPVARPSSSRHLAAPEVRAGLPECPRQTRVDQGDVDVLTLAGALTHHLRGHDRVDRGRPGCDVVDGDADLGRTPARLSGHPQEARHALGHDVEARAVPVRAGLPESADRAVEDVASDGPDGVVVDPEPTDHSGPEVLDDEVRLCGEPQE